VRWQTGVLDVDRRHALGDQRAPEQRQPLRGAGADDDRVGLDDDAVHASQV
jgi:hypothetical protein